MKFKAVASLCKSSKHIEKCGQFIGDHLALYPFQNLPELNKSQIFTLFDIPESKQDKFVFKESSPEELGMSFEDVEQYETPIQQETELELGYLGHTMLPYNTSEGIRFIDARYLEPFKGHKGGYELYERQSEGGDIYIAVKSGMFLIGLIRPLSITNPEFVAALDRLARLSAVTLGIWREKQLSIEEDIE